MSSTAQANNKTQPWSRGRGFRPKGPFQPARRPGEPGGNSSAQEIKQTPSNHGNKPSNNSQTNNSNQGNNSYVNNRESGPTPNQKESSLSNGYQDRGSHGNSFQGSSSTRDFRFAGKNQQQQQQGGCRPASNQVQSRNHNGAGDIQGANSNEPRLLAKYTYKANPNSPLGEPELPLTQGQKVALIAKHPNNDQWWKVRADDGNQGYIPATYVMAIEKKVTALPWLANQSKEYEELPEAKPVYKPYVSAYNKPAQEKEEPEEKKPNLDYYCNVCEKQLNGPKPYGAHMVSKAHKEEVEFARESGKM
ncbi:uncharacterized protein [Amphiura filiformis]|uniref:uncharacterized protein n=1 Tax=Amphiura filiformis TaxID=82378 RepID=UPI003B219C87